MKAKIKKVVTEKTESQKSNAHDLSERKKNLEHRIKALRKIIEQLGEEGKSQNYMP